MSKNLTCSNGAAVIMGDVGLALHPSPQAGESAISRTPLSGAPALDGKEAAQNEGWFWPLSRAAIVVAAGCAAWFIAGNWEHWAGAVRYQATENAYLTGDLTALSAKVSGYIARVSFKDFQSVRRGDLLAEIDPADYQSQLNQAQANQTAAAANLANVENQKAVQRALIRQAEAAMRGTAADVGRYHLEALRQRALVGGDRLAGTPQAVELANANEIRTVAQLLLNNAQLDQQKALLESLDVQQTQLAAVLGAAQATTQLAENNLRYTQVRSPVDGMTGQRLVQLGQFVNVGSQIVAVMPLPDIWVIANYKETQMTNIRVGQPARVTVDAFPDLVLTALLAPDNATGNFTKVVQRMPVKILLDAVPSLGTLVRPGMSVEASIDTGEQAPGPAITASARQVARAAGQ